ncbi:MAG: Rossmann-fold NAD(P)-binding domain-containing protein, partial [Acidimicrobiales bacterium]
PTWFKEEMSRVGAPRSRVERSLLEVETYLRDFADDNPHVTVTLLRFSNVVGTDIVTPITKALQLPLAPCILGFDPLIQFVEEDDVVRAIEYVTSAGIPGIFNVAGDGRLPWSEVAAICGKRLIPMPPFATELASSPLSLLGVELPQELLDVLRYGRGIDNRRLKAAGFQYRYTSAGAVANFAGAMRLERTVGSRRPVYHYEQDVEQFFRHSPAVVRDPATT